MISIELDLEIERNFRSFQQKLENLLRHHRNRFALMRHEEVIGIYDTLMDAKLTGDKFYEDGLFSIQKVEDRPIDLGYFSHAVHMGSSQ